MSDPKLLEALTAYDRTALKKTRTLVQDKEGNVYEETISPEGVVTKTFVRKSDKKVPTRSPYRKFERYNASTGDWEKVKDPDVPVPLGKLSSITLVTYNVWFVEKFFVERRAALCSLLEDSEADVICLQEVTERFLQFLITRKWVQEKYAISDTHGHTGTRRGCVRSGVWVMRAEEVDVAWPKRRERGGERREGA